MFTQFILNPSRILVSYADARPDGTHTDWSAARVLPTVPGKPWDTYLLPHVAPDGTGTCVPELSRFYGIIIRMFVEAGSPHQRAHFHAYYQDQAAVVAIDTLEILGGGLPKVQQRLVEAWAEIHRAELQHDWDLLQSGQPPVKIEPLR